MHAHPEWRSTVALTCSLVAIVGVIIWSMRKNSSKKTKQENKCKKTNSTDTKNTTEDCQCDSSEDEVEEDIRADTIPELPEPNWKKVATVQELYIYPLKSGRGKDITECDFTLFGMSLKNESRLTIRDRMFLVYNEETGRYQTGRHYPTMILISVSAVDEFKVKLEAVGMPSVNFAVPDVSKKNSEAMECKMWGDETVNFIDCGQEPAEWLSRFLTGTNSGLRLGCAVLKSRHITGGPFEKQAAVYNTIRDRDSGLFSDMVSYMLMSSESMDQLNEKLEKPVPALQFRPNILISGSDPFAEDDWEWIKIGESAVIRNVRPCARCKMIGLQPDTGVMDLSEPMKTLKSFRAQTDPERIAVDGKFPLMGIYCGLYSSGKVKVGDDVFVHVPNKTLESNHHECTEKSEAT